MSIREGKSGNAPSVRGSRFKRPWLFVLAISLLQVKKARSFTDHAFKTGSSQALHNQSLNSPAVISIPLAISGKDGFRSSKTHSSLEKQGINQGRHHLATGNDFKKTHLAENTTRSSERVTHLYDVTHFMNNSKNPRTSTLTSRGNLGPAEGSSKLQKTKKGGTSITKRELKLLSNKLGLSRHQHYERKSLSGTPKTYVKSRRKKRRKYHSPIHSGHHRRSHYRHRHRKVNLQRRKSVDAGENKLNDEEFTRNRRSLQHQAHFRGNNRRFPLFRGSERVLLRFKRKSLLEEDDEKPSKSGKKHKRQKRRQTLREHATPRSLPPFNPVVLPQNGFTNKNYPRNKVWKRPGLTRNPIDRAIVTNNNAISQAKYDPLIYGGRTSSLSLNPNQYNTFNDRRVSISNVNKPPSAPVSPVNVELNSNKLAQGLPFRSETVRADIVPAWNTRFQNAASIKQMNIQQPVKSQFGNKQPRGSRLLKGNDQSKKQFIPATQRVLYGYEQQAEYPSHYSPQMAFAGGNPQNTPYRQTGPISPQFFSPKRAKINPQWSSVLPAMSYNSHVSVDGDAWRRSRVSQGLIMYLNFEDVQSGRATYASLKGDVTDTDKRTEITRSYGSCGKVARLNNGSEILLKGGQLKEKPRQAISLAAWIKLDNNKGYHSIFDTVGGHSAHKNGQYHFEIQDASVRWFHRNESEDQIFSVETDPIIPANVWNHIVGTYNALTGIAKIFVNGRLKAEAAGKGLLSQDWDAHAGIGKHKDERFLQGEVDEFRIYNKALSQDEVQNLMKTCSFERGCGGFFYSPAGIFESPEWPKSYKGKTSCTWHVSVDPGEKIALSFKRFSLDEDGTCGKAKLVVRDGSSENSKALGVYCGVKRPPEVTSSGNHLWVQFTSTEGAEGKGFLMSYDTATSRQTKKTERPPTPTDDSQRCAVTRPEYNVTLIGGIKSGIFSEAKNVHDMDLCTRHCCLRRSCDLAFMIRDSCYLVQCHNAMFCKTKKARPSNMNPRITFVSHLQAVTPEPELSADGNAYSKAMTPGLSKPTTQPAQVQPMCHHTEVSYNVTLVGGINAGKFSTYGRTRTMNECIRHCCRDNKCDVSFMIQGNCYAVECADTEGCQVKRAKPSSYNPTVAYVYRGNQRPIGDPLPGAEKPSQDACDKYSVSNTIYNVTLRGGITSGNFTDKGVVKHMDECSAFCCADERCNVAFLIRDNCFLVSCKDYDSCKVKPALSEYYHPRLTFVNWSPPDDEIPANRWYASLGCWRDTESFAVASLEGSDPLLTEPYVTRSKPIDTCAQVARRHEFKVFAIQNGGACLSGPTAGRMFNQFGESSSCKAGKGGLFANDVYRLTDSGSYVSLGCWNDSGIHALPILEHSDTQLDDFYKSRLDPLRKCGEVARKRGYTVFALQRGGMCFGGPRAEINYRKYGISRRCRDGLGGPYANNVYRLIDNLDLEVGPTESTQNTTSPTGTTGSSTFSTGTTGSSSSTSSNDFTPTALSGTQRSPATSPSPTPTIHENYLTLQDGLPHKNTYTAGEILFNVTLKFGIKAGKFDDKGKLGNMSECVRACGRMESCSLAFMLGKQCFAVSCYNDALCLTKPAYSPFYKPKIAFVKHTKVIVSANTTKPSSEVGQCRASAVHNDVTLVGGINAGKFTDLGDADNMSICTQRCCMKDACDVAFMLEGECYGVSCVNDSLCETRPARNPARYNPKIAYVYHDKKKDKAVRRPKLRAVMKMIERLLYGKTLQKQTGTQFVPLNDKNTDNTDFTVDSDANNDASSDVSNTLSGSSHPIIRNIDESFNTDMFTPTIPQMHFEKLLNNIKGGQMNVYALPVFYDDYESETGLTGASATPFPPKGMNSLSGSKLNVASSSPSQNMLGAFMKEINSPKINHVTSVGDVMHVNPHVPAIRTRPLIDLSLGTTNDDPRANHVQLNSQQNGLTVDKVLKGLLHKWLHINKHARKWRDENEGLPGYYDNTNDDLMSLSNKDLDRFADYAMLRLGYRQNPLTFQDTFTNNSPLRVYENPQEIAQRINALFDLPSTASTQQKSVCWDGEILHNYTLVGGINAGTFSDNGKTSNMDLCMQFCCKRESCDLAFMIEDDCYSVACNSNGACEPRKARPTHYFPRIAIRKKPQGDYRVKGLPTDISSTPGTSSSSPSPTPTPSPSASSSLTPATSPSPSSRPVLEAHEDSSLNPPVKVAHSCDATPIEYNVTLKMGLHSGVFQKIGRVDSMDDCIEMSCKQPNSDVAFMLGSMCYAVRCYSADLCKTVPIFGSSISRLNLNPAISFLKKKPRFGLNSLAVANDYIAQDKCRDSTITYNVTLRGGIDAGNFTERAGIQSMRDCIGKCCDDTSCDLAFMFGDHCYSVQCQSEKVCQAVVAKPSHLEPKVSYVSRGFLDDDKDKGTMFSASDQTPTCRADQKTRSKIVSNKTLVGGLEAGKFSFVGVVSNMDMCMDRCCAQRGCNVAYMVDKNCFSVACFSPSLCKISDVSSTNGDVEISTIMESTAERPAEKHSMVVYVIIGVVGFAAGAGGILWAVCMFIRRHRLRSRHRQDTE